MNLCLTINGSCLIHLIICHDTAGDNNEVLNFPIELLSSLNLPSSPPRKLILKRDSPINLLRNIIRHNFVTKRD